MSCPPYISSDHTYLHQVPKTKKMATFHQTDAFAQLRATVVAEQEYLRARGQTLDWWSLDEDGEPKFLTTVPFAELYRRLHGVVLDWREADNPGYKNTACPLWNEFLEQEFDIEDYIAHLLDGFPTAGEEVDAVVKNVFLRLWHNDLYKFTKKGQIATKSLCELGKICRALVPPEAASYFNSIVEERKAALALKKKIETDLAETLYRIGVLSMDPAEALCRVWRCDELPQNPATKKVIIARILSNNAAFSYDVPEELR